MTTRPDPLPDASTEYGARVRRRLEEEKTAWLTTVGEDGTPEPNPVWFLWWDGAVLLYNQNGAKRLDHIRARPHVALHLNATSQGGDIVVLTGTAEVLDGPRPDAHPGYLAKYGADIDRIADSVEKFADAYATPVRITVDRVRGH